MVAHHGRPKFRRIIYAGISVFWLFQASCAARLVVVTDSGRDSASMAWDCKLPSKHALDASDCHRAEDVALLKPSSPYRRLFVGVDQTLDAAADHTVALNYRNRPLVVPVELCPDGVRRWDLFLAGPLKRQLRVECALPDSGGIQFLPFQTQGHTHDD